MSNNSRRYIPFGIFVISLLAFAILSYLVSAADLYRHMPVAVGKVLFQCLMGMPGIALALAIKGKDVYLRRFVIIGSIAWLIIWLLGFCLFLLARALVLHR